MSHKALKSLGSSQTKVTSRAGHRDLWVGLANMDRVSPLGPRLAGWALGLPKALESPLHSLYPLFTPPQAASKILEPKPEHNERPVYCRFQYLKF